MLPSDAPDLLREHEEDHLKVSQEAAEDWNKKEEGIESADGNPKTPVYTKEEAVKREDEFGERVDGAHAKLDADTVDGTRPRGGGAK